MLDEFNIFRIFFFCIRFRFARVCNLIFLFSFFYMLFLMYDRCVSESASISLSKTTLTLMLSCYRWLVKIGEELIEDT
mgnify:CR=1 FL=1